MTAAMPPPDGRIPMRVTITARYYADPASGFYDSPDPAEVARADLEVVIGSAALTEPALADLVDALGNCGDLDDAAVTITPGSPLPAGPTAGPACAWLSAGATAKLLGILTVIAGASLHNRQDPRRADGHAVGEGDPRALAAEALALLGVGAGDGPTARSQP
jgi:hypothetical protein